VVLALDVSDGRVDVFCNNYNFRFLRPLVWFDARLSAHLLFDKLFN
jgi:hypothetical protein